VDLGCGTEECAINVLKRLKKKSITISVVDISSMMIKIASSIMDKIEEINIE
jgi:ubiquinone/menaquinone biosynthesis C-methylase UbiE